MLQPIKEISRFRQKNHTYLVCLCYCGKEFITRQDAETSMVYHTKSTLASTTSPFMVRVRDVDTTKSKIIVEAF